MTQRPFIMSALVLGALAAGSAMAQDKPMTDKMAKMEKCYGVSMAGPPRFRQ